MVRIFLAHVIEDRVTVSNLYHRLKESGFQPWMDREDLLPGQSRQAEISKAIKESDVFIACLSQQSVQKQGCVQREFRMALNAMADRPPGKIFLIPVCLDACQIPELRQEEYGISLSDYQWVNLYESDGYERLVRGIEKGFADELAQTKKPPKPVVRTFSFEVATVDSAGKINQRELKTSQYYREDLGNGVHLDLIRIPGDRFWIGSSENELGRSVSEGPRHKVQVPDFYMGRYPVTQRQWQAISLLDDVDMKLSPDPSKFKGDDRPVEQVSWDNAVEFCKRLSQKTGSDYRLPSEAEWEYACRAGTTTPFHFGDTITMELANYQGLDDVDFKDSKFLGSYGDGPKGEYREQTTDVGSFSANAFGLYDMHGNVREWCLDIYHANYEGTPIDGSAWVEDGDASCRLLRGGSWKEHPRLCRSAARLSFYSELSRSDIGFRVVCPTL